jgi:anti-sigma B factor antagonist
MKFNKRLIDDVAVVALSGALDHESALDVQDKIAKVLPQHEHVVIDFSRVSCVSSASLRTMVLIYRQAQALGHTVAVVGLSPEVHNVLDCTGFLDFFVLSDSVTDAVASVLNRSEGRRERDHAIAART